MADIYIQNRFVTEFPYVDIAPEAVSDTAEMLEDEGCADEAHDLTHAMVLPYGMVHDEIIDVAKRSGMEGDKLTALGHGVKLVEALSAVMARDTLGREAAPSSRTIFARRLLVGMAKSSTLFEDPWIASKNLRDDAPGTAQVIEKVTYPLYGELAAYSLAGAGLERYVILNTVKDDDRLAVGSIDLT